VKYSFMSGGKKEERTLELFDFIEIKGWKALGNKLMDKKILTIDLILESNEDPVPEVKIRAVKTKSQSAPSLFDQSEDKNDALKTGDTIEFDI